jgi:hypothetical protein
MPEGRLDGTLEPVNLFVPIGHYYSPIVSPSQVGPESIAREGVPKKDMPGIDIDDEKMSSFWSESKELLSQCKFPDEKGKGRYYYKNGFYSYGDAIMLNVMMRKFEPRNIIEIGSGFSSACMLDTLETDARRDVSLTFIEPNPERLNHVLREEDSAWTLCIERPVQEVPLSVFESLDENDILFIDSTHVSKVGSDVNYLYFNVIPMLKPGVLIHVHDVFYPFEYPERWVIHENRSWNEVYLLRAFPMFNASVEIMFFNDYFRRYHAAEIAASCPTFLRHPGGAIWLKRTAM